MSALRVVGLMSGTSYDAIDAAAADLDLEGDTLVLTPLGMISTAYGDDLRAALSGALPPSRPIWPRCAGSTRGSDGPSPRRRCGPTANCATDGPI